jgi:hypothetical protein
VPLAGICWEVSDVLLEVDTGNWGGMNRDTCLRRRFSVVGVSVLFAHLVGGGLAVPSGAVVRLRLPVDGGVLGGARNWSDPMAVGGRDSWFFARRSE